MSWNKLAPIAKTNGRPMASASIVVNKDGVAKISLILSASLKDEFGDPQRCDISAGEGEDAGSILVEFADDGAFDVKNFVHGGARLFLPLIAGCPEKAVANAPCALGAKIGVGPEALAEGQRPSVVIALPLAAWRGNIDTRMTPAVRPAPTLPASPPPAPKVGNGQPLDMVEYLSGRGVTIARLANNRFQVNGELMLAGQVLKLVNDHRKAADLDPLPAAKVW